MVTERRCGNANSHSTRPPTTPRIGGAFGGILSDKIGRKKVLIGAVAFYGVFTLPQAFASDLTMFAAFRLIAGLGVGSCIPVVYTVFSEVMPSNRRGFFITCGGACMVGGWVIAGLVANPICNATTPLLGGFTEMVTYTNADGTTATMFSNWRLCYLIGGIPVLYAIFLAFAMRETAHWYANTGQTEKAIEVLLFDKDNTPGTGIQVPYAAYRTLANDVEVRTQFDKHRTPVVDAAWGREVLNAVKAAAH